MISNGEPRSAVPAVNRRSLLRGGLAGVGALAVPGLLAACDPAPSGGATTVTYGSNFSDPIPKQAMAAMVAAYQNEPGHHAVKVNTVDHNSFQENINRYLKGNPDDVFTWFAGNRMKFFAAQGLVADISDVWHDIGGHFSDAVRAAATGEDGKQYFVPQYNYPWAVFYRPSLFAQHGYQVPKTYDDLLALCRRMKADGLDAFAFADKDGWPAMGTFDQLDMRINGYDFHIALMDGEQSWTDPKVKQVFTTWAELLPYHQAGANGRGWHEAAQAVQQKKAAMMVIGSGQITQQFSGQDASDLDFFPYPVINEQYGQDAVEAPIDGFMIAKKAKNLAAAKDFIRFLAGAKAEDAYQKVDAGNLPTNREADRSGFTPLLRKCADYIAGAKQISQFMDRDTRPDFASTVMIPALQSFINAPGDIDGLLRNIEAQKKTIFAN